MGYTLSFLIGVFICFFVMLSLFHQTLAKISNRGFYQYDDNLYIVTKKDIVNNND